MRYYAISVHLENNGLSGDSSAEIPDVDVYDIYCNFSPSTID